MSASMLEPPDRAWRNSMRLAQDGDVSCCIALVSEPPHYLRQHQCTRKNGYGREGLFCKQHSRQWPVREVRDE